MNYYNEFDPKAAEWLRQLIAGGHIPAGDVDTRSIIDVQPSDLCGYTQCHFFAGIGGWSRALRLAGWPEDRPVWTGSCPCQPFSAAGKLLGEADPRHLWPQFRRLVRACEPSVVFGEQVASKAGRVWLAGVRSDLEAMGYAIGAADLCAAGVGAPHIRQRLYWVANADCGERYGLTAGEGCERHGQAAGRIKGDSESQCGRRVSGMGDTESSFWGVPVFDWRPHKENSQPGRAGPVSGVGDMQQQRLEGHPRHGDSRSESGRLNPRTARSVTTAGSFVQRMGDTPSGRWGVGGDAARTPTGGHSIGASWSGFERVHCRDGKARRFEPHSFPLAHGVPGRVGLLRGYGNAIVPPLAAEFIQAAEEARILVASGV